MAHRERHRAHRIGWLRASVLGANDGIISTASLVLGVAAAEAARSDIATAGIAGLVAGAMSMAAGEFVSVSSQKDTEEADLRRERAELEHDPDHEHAELAAIYRDRGVDAPTAEKVAAQMMEHDALAAHARDELGLSEETAAQPVVAALSSAAAFAVGAAVPLVVVGIAPDPVLVPSVAAASLASLAALGAMAARAGNANTLVGAARVVAWGAFAMAATTAIGRWIGGVVA